MLSIYFVLTPSNLIFSLSTTFNNKSFFLYIGKPSKSKIECLMQESLLEVPHHPTTCSKIKNIISMV